MIDRKKLGTILLVVSVVLILMTVYLAIFFAPLPPTGVKSAGEILSSVEGSRLQVAGFVSAVYYRSPMDALDVPEHVVFSIADFRDYGRYLQAAAGNDLDMQWWTVRPIDVDSVSGGLASWNGPYVGERIVALTNLSVYGIVTSHGIAPNSNVTGFSLLSRSGDDFTFGPVGGFGLMTAPVAQKIFYFHMPSAWACYLAFGVTLAGSALFLKTRDHRFDRVAYSSAEIGIVFATIAILTGPVWAKQEWGVYWRWDDMKLVTTFVLWLVYIGYLSLRAAISEPSTKARVSAVYGILSFITVPMSFLSSRVAPLLQSSHPQVIATSSGSLSPQAGMTIGIAVVAFTVLFITMLIKRVEIAEAEEELEELKRKIGDEE
jgi:heme exporter protein C